jgi:hypothetical protein
MKILLKKLNELDVKVENHDKVLKDILDALSIPPQKVRLGFLNLNLA